MSAIDTENKDYNKEDKSVCYQPPVGVDSENKSSLGSTKENSVAEAKRGLTLPSILKKNILMAMKLNVL